MCSSSAQAWPGRFTHLTKAKDSIALSLHINTFHDFWGHDAIEYKKLNIEFYPRIFQLYNSLAESYAGLGDADNAIMYLRKSIEIKPENNIANDRLKALTAKR